MPRSSASGKRRSTAPSRSSRSSTARRAGSRRSRREAPAADDGGQGTGRRRQERSPGRYGASPFPRQPAPASLSVWRWRPKQSERGGARVPPASAAAPPARCSASSIRRPASAAAARPASRTRSAPAAGREIQFIERPYCERLGTPFAVDLGMALLSPAAIADPPVFERARAVARYDDVARKLVHRLKYGDRLELAPGARRHDGPLRRRAPRRCRGRSCRCRSIAGGCGGGASTRRWRSRSVIAKRSGLPCDPFAPRPRQGDEAPGRALEGAARREPAGRLPRADGGEAAARRQARPPRRRRDDDRRDRERRLARAPARRRQGRRRARLRPRGARPTEARCNAAGTFPYCGCNRSRCHGDDLYQDLVPLLHGGEGPPRAEGRRLHGDRDHRKAGAARRDAGRRRTAARPCRRSSSASAMSAAATTSTRSTRRGELDKLLAVA